MWRLLLAIAAILASTAVPARAASPGAAPLDFVSTDGVVYAIERHADTVYLGGNFDHVRTRLDGAISLDGAGARSSPEFPRVDGGPITAIVPDGTGGWFLGGGFTRVNNMPMTNLAHVNAAGAVDVGFSGSSLDPVTALVRVGSSLYAATATFNTHAIVKLNATTRAIDSFFTAPLDGDALTLTSDGAALYVGGKFSYVGTDGAAPRLARLSLATGAVDHAFNPVPDGIVRTITLAGGALYAGGEFATIDGQGATPRLARLNPADGTASTAFAPAPDQPVNTLWYDGARLFVGGEFAAIKGQMATPRLAKVDPANGAADLAFDPAPDQPVRALWHDGASLYAGGTFGRVDGRTASLLVARLNPVTGAVDPAFRPDFGGQVTVLTGAGGAVIAGGSLGRSYALRNLARIDLATGTIDAGFHPDPTDEVGALLYDGSSLYVGGSFATIGGQTATPKAARVDAVTGAVDLTFHPPNLAGAIVDGIHRVGAGYLLNGAPALLTKVDASGGVDASFSATIDDRADAVVVAGSSVYVGGYFQMVNNQFATPRLAKLDAATGKVDLGFAPAPAGETRALAYDGTSLYASGPFGGIGGQPAGIGQLAKLSPVTGMANPAFSPKPGTTPFALWREGTWLYAGGGFTSIGSQTGTPRLARVDAASGAVDTTYNPSPDATVRVIRATSTSVFAGGQFTTVDSIAHQGFALVGPPRPGNSSPPTITGAAQPGNALRCGDGTWSDFTLPFAYRWLADGTPVDGQTGTTLALAQVDVGKHFACEVTARNGTGPAVAVSAPVAVTAGAAEPPTVTSPTPGSTTPAPTGTPGPTATVTADATAPVLSAVSLTRRRFRAKQGSTFRFNVSEQATVNVRITRKGSRSVRGTLKRTVAKGAQRLVLPGRSGRGALAPGAYEGAVTATDTAGNRSRTVVVRFTVVR